MNTVWIHWCVSFPACLYFLQFPAPGERLAGVHSPSLLFEHESYRLGPRALRDRTSNGRWRDSLQLNTPQPGFSRLSQCATDPQEYSIIKDSSRLLERIRVAFTQRFRLCHVAGFKASVTFSVSQSPPSHSPFICTVTVFMWRITALTCIPMTPPPHCFVNQFAARLSSWDS